jgi:CSLREA domain-containing protein
MCTERDTVTQGTVSPHIDTMHVLCSSTHTERVKRSQRKYIMHLWIAHVVMLCTVAMPCIAAQIHVTTFLDNSRYTTDGLCSLREAVTASNWNVRVDGCAAGGDKDTILVPGGYYPLMLADDPYPDAVLVIQGPVTIRGQGVWPHGTILDAQYHSRIFQIDNPTNRLVTLQNLELVHGGRDHLVYAGEIQATPGVIYHTSGPLLLRNIACYWNQNGCYYKTDYSDSAAGFWRNKTRIVDSTLLSNVGGAIHGAGYVHVQRTQIIDNTPLIPDAHEPGPAYAHYIGGRVTFEDVFMSGNWPPSGFGGQCAIGAGVRIRLWGENVLDASCTHAPLLE